MHLVLAAVAVIALVAAVEVALVELETLSGEKHNMPDAHIKLHVASYALHSTIVHCMLAKPNMPDAQFAHALQLHSLCLQNITCRMQPALQEGSSARWCFCIALINTAFV